MSERSLFPRATPGYQRARSVKKPPKAAPSGQLVDDPFFTPVHFRMFTFQGVWARCVELLSALPGGILSPFGP